MTNRGMRSPALLAGLLVTTAIMAGLLGGCGNSSETVTPPGAVNPFLAVKTGTDSTLEVMTWNLENFAKNGSTTSDLVAQALAAVDADIIGLQEIGSSLRFDEVVADLDGWSGYKANSTGYSQDLAYIYRTDGLLEVDSIQEIMTGEWSAFPRRPLLLLGSFAGTPIAVINNHLKCCGDGFLDEDDSGDEETRRRAACLLLEDYALTHLGGHSIFLIGDFNDELTDTGANNVFANLLGDPANWRAADMSIAEGPSNGWSFPGWPSHLDHIFINQPLFAGADAPEAQVRVLPLHRELTGGWSAYDTNISDHLPVIIRLQP